MDDLIFCGIPNHAQDIRFVLVWCVVVDMCVVCRVSRVACRMLRVVFRVRVACCVSRCMVGVGWCHVVSCVLRVACCMLC